MANLDKGDSNVVADQANNINAQIEDAATDLPGNADNGEAALKTLEEQN